MFLIADRPNVSFAGEQNILYAAGLNNLSLVYLDKNDLKAAERCQKSAVAILYCLPQHRDELASSLCNLGSLYCRKGLLEQAEIRLRQSIELFEMELGTDTPHYHAALNNLGTVYLKQREYEKTADMLWMELVKPCY